MRPNLAELQLNAFAYEAFFLDGLENLREGYKKVRGAFYRVVEDYDCAWLKVWDYVAGAFFAIDVAAVVAAYDTPHYCVVFIL